MANITYRNSTTPTVPEGTTAKTTPLTIDEVDGNFKSLNDAKMEKSNNLSDLANPATARNNLGVDAAGTAVALAIALG